MIVAWMWAALWAQFVMLWGGVLLGMMGRYGIPFGGPSGGTTPTVVVGAGAASIKGLGLVDSIAREGDVSAVDTWTAIQNVGSGSVGDINVPIDAQALSRIDVTASFDMETPAGGLATIMGFRLSGNGLSVGGVHRYLGPACTAGGKTAGEAAARTKVMSLPMRVAVKGGNQIGIEAIMLGEDVGTVTMMFCLTFTKSLRAQGIEDGDFREGDITAVDTDTTLTAVGSSTLGNIKIPVERNIIAATVGVLAADVGADNTGTLRCAMLCQVSGPALKEGGTFRFLSEAIQITATTTGVFMTVSEPDPQPLDINVKGGNELELHAMLIGEDPGQATVAVGLLYGSAEEGLL